MPRRLPSPAAPFHLVVVTMLVLAGVSGASASAPIEVSVAGRAIQPGEVLRIDVDCACDTTALQATVFDRSLPLVHVGGTRWEVLVGIDLETPPGVYPLVVGSVTGEAIEPRVSELRVLPRQFRTRTLRVSEAFVTPPTEVTARIARELKVTDAVFKTMSTRGWEGPFLAPVPGPSANNFGARTVFNGQPRRPHAGLDYSVPAGTPIAAPAGGRVVLAEDLYFTGNTVIIDHGQGLFSLFAHLSNVLVERGAAVPAGTPVGTVGATGRATGPHLHWGVRLNGARVDPLSLLAATAAPRR